MTSTARHLPPPGSAPFPPAGPPHIRYPVGSRVTDLIHMPDGWRRLVGDVTATNCWLLTVRWAGGHGEARYAHGHEPDTLRHATPDDERAAIDHHERQAVAAELRRQARAHPHWPADIRRALTARATQLAGRL